MRFKYKITEGKYKEAKDTIRSNGWTLYNG